MDLGRQKLPSVTMLMVQAESDEKIMRMSWISESILCCHARDAVGHLLVALLTALKIPYGKTESLKVLRSLLEQHGETLPSTAILLKNRADFTEEYEYSLLSPDEPLERERIVAGVRTLREYVVKRLAELARPA